VVISPDVGDRRRRPQTANNQKFKYSTKASSDYTLTSRYKLGIDGREAKMKKQLTIVIKLGMQYKNGLK
jgi:hypothetical protein